MAIGDVLLARFKHAVAQQLAAPPGAARDVAVAQALDALALLAQHAEAAPLLESLLAWRLAALREGGAAPGAPPVAADVTRRRASAVDAAFWEAVCRLAGEAEGRPPPAHVAEALEALAFEALLASEGDEAERDRVARALGLLSRRRFDAVTARCLRELDARLRTDTHGARADVAQLARAMRQLHLPLATAAEAAAAAAFLRAAAPLRWVPVKKKGEWHHALCGALSGWLAPAVGRRAPGASAPAWADALAAVRAETFAWVAKAERKHLPHGYPLATLLLCLEGEAGEPQLRAFLEGPLPRALRDKPSRVAALDCLRTACAFYAAARGRAPPAPDALWAAAAAAVAGLPAALRRSGGLARSDGPEAADALVAIAAVAAQVEPALVLEGLLPELIAPRGEPPLGDGPAAGLRALAAVCAVAGAGPARGGGRAAADATPEGLADALLRLRRGGSALGELGIGGALPAALRSALGAAARAASASLAPPAVRGAPTLPPPDAASCATLTALLACVPYALPDEWRGVKLAEALPPFQRHPDAAVRAAAAAATRRAVHAGGGGRGPAGAPGVRSALLVAALETAARAAEAEALCGIAPVAGTAAEPSGAAAAAALARSMAAEWAAAARLDATDGCVAEGLEAWRAEGAALALASAAVADPPLRRAALALLHDLAALGRALPPVQAHAAPALAVVAPDAVAKAAAAMAAWPLRAPGASPSPAPLPQGAGLEEAASRVSSGGWAACLGSSLCAAAPLCAPALAAARTHAVRRMVAAAQALAAAGADVAAASAAVDVWRAAACVAAAGIAADAGGREAGRALLAPLAVPHAAGAPAPLADAAELALRCVPPASAATVLDEVAPWLEEAARSRGRRAAELRTAAARTVAALCAGSAALGAATHGRLCAYADDAARTLAVAPPAPALLPSGAAVGVGDCSCEELAAQRHALACAACAAPAATWPQPLRVRLFALCAAWADGSVLEAERAAAAAKLAGAKPLSAAERAAAEAELADAAEAVRAAAADACAQLAAAPGWDDTAATPLAWAAATLARCATAAAPASAQAAHTRDHCAAAACRALRAAAVASAAALPACLEGAYAAPPAAASAHFAALSEGFVAHASAATDAACAVSPSALAAAALFRLCDARPGARADAGALLRALAATQRWATEPPPPAPPGTPLAALGAPVAALGTRLARTRPELCDAVAAEALERAAAAPPGLPRAALQRCLAALPPWLEGVSLPRAEATGAAASRLLDALLRLSDDGGAVQQLHHGADGGAAEALWRALAARPTNAAAALEFLLARACEAAAPAGPADAATSDAEADGADADASCALAASAAFACGAKRCALACARAQPRAAAAALLAQLARRRNDADAARDAAAALILLAAVASEPRPELRAELRAAAPLLLHAALLTLGGAADAAAEADETEHAAEQQPGGAAVAEAHARTLLCALLAAAEEDAGTGAACAADAGVACLTARLRAGALPALWHHGADADAALAALVSALVAALAAPGGAGAAGAAQRAAALRARWAAEALAWATDAASAADAARSAAVLRGLRAPLGQASAAALCECAAACLAPARAGRAPVAAAAFAAQCVAALASAAAATTPSKLLLYPCAFWAAAAALRAPAPALAPHACALLLTMLRALPCGGPAAPPGVAEEVLLLAAPGVAGLPGAAGGRQHPFPGLTRLALRAAAGGHAPAAAAALLARLAALPRGGAADALFGEADSRTWLCLGGALPWLLAAAAADEEAARWRQEQRERGSAAEPEPQPQHGAAHADAPLARHDAAGWLTDAMRCRRGGAPLAAALAAWPLPPPEALREPLALALTPTAAAALAAALLAVLRGGPPEWAPSVLALLAATFDAPCGVRPAPDLSALTAAAAGPHAPAARAALAAALRAAARPVGAHAAAAAAAGAALTPLWPEPDADAAAALLGDALAGGGAKRRDAPAFLFRV